MKTTLFKFSMLLAVTTVFFGCNPEEDLMQREVAGESIKNTGTEECETVTFDRGITRDRRGFVNGVQSDQSSTVIGVSAFRRTAVSTYGTTNYANIFFSGQPYSTQHNDQGTQIDDILTPHMDFGGGGVGDGGKMGSPYANNTPLGNMLIINRGDDPSQAYDYNQGGYMEFNFTNFGTVSLSSVTVLDVDEYEAAGKVVLYGPTMNELKTVNFQVSGNNGKQIVQLGGTQGVAYMRVYLGPGIYRGQERTGSGAIDNIVFNCRPSRPREYGCTYTQGYWKNHATGKKADRNWNGLYDDRFYMSGMDYLELMNTPPKGGNAYIQLAHQYIAAKLNLGIASSTPEVTNVFNLATTYFQTVSLSSPYSNGYSKNQLTQWAGILGAYNEGKIGPGHCDDNDDRDDR